MESVDTIDPILREHHPGATGVIHEQATLFLRNLIVSGRLAPGSQVPSTRALAQLWGINPSTVQTALTTLVKEGFLQRLVGRGTIVREREQRLTCLALYLQEDVWATHTSDFLMSIHAALKEELNRTGIRLKVFADPRPATEQATPCRDLCEAVQRREVQGLIVPATDWSHVQWLNKLPVPSAYFASGNIPNKVCTNPTQLAELSLRCLAEQGCRSVGFVGLADPNHSEPDGSRNPDQDFFERFTDLAGDLGLVMKNEWMRIRGTGAWRKGSVWQEQFGYEEFLALWSQPERPDGLVVFPDTTARGVILGLREKQVRVPEEMKLVMHKNESTPLFCPMPATFMMLSERACARALIEQVQRQFRGEDCEPVTIDMTLSSTANEGHT